MNIFFFFVFFGIQFGQNGQEFSLLTQFLCARTFFTPNLNPELSSENTIYILSCSFDKIGELWGRYFKRRFRRERAELSQSARSYLHSPPPPPWGPYWRSSTSGIQTSPLLLSIFLLVLIPYHQEGCCVGYCPNLFSKLEISHNQHN